MKKRIRLFQAVSVCLILVVWQMAHGDQGSSPAFWTVQTKDRQTTVYLMGSMHFGHPNFYPLPPIIDQSFIASDTLVVEVDITKIEPMKAMAAIMKHGRLPAGQTLNQIISDETQKVLKDYCVRNGVSMATMQPFKPWFAALQIVEGQLRKTPFKQHLGVDNYFLTQAKGKQVVALETLDGQLSLFANLDNMAQDGFLRQTLTDLSDSQSYLYLLAEQWQQGDVRGMEESLIAPFKTDKSTAALFKALFTDRNAAMSRAVEGYFSPSSKAKSVFFVVGAGHMVGADGIVNRLKNKGYRVARVDVGKISAGKSLLPSPTTSAQGLNPSAPDVKPQITAPMVVPDHKPARRGRGS